MARSRRSRSGPFDQINPGDTFALPLEDGRWTACRILGKSSDRRSVLVISSAWIGAAPPDDLTDPQLRVPLILTHHSWSGADNAIWVSDPVPAEAVLLGNLPLTAEEAARNAASWGGWGSLQIQPLLQWRWDHDCEAVL